MQRRGGWEIGLKIESKQVAQVGRMGDRIKDKKETASGARGDGRKVFRLGVNQWSKCIQGSALPLHCTSLSYLDKQGSGGCRPESCGVFCPQVILDILKGLSLQHHTSLRFIGGIFYSMTQFTVWMWVTELFSTKDR